jgi:hypothetical protein
VSAGGIPAKTVTIFGHVDILWSGPGLDGDCVPADVVRVRTFLGLWSLIC